MSSVWQQLEVSALLGTGKSSPLSGWPAPLVPLMSTLPEPNSSRALLVQLAISAVWQRAGMQPVALAAVAPALPEDTLRPLNPSARKLLCDAMDRDYPKDLRFILLQNMAGKGFRVDARHLPALLKDATDTSMRLLLGQIVGQRGAWLARQNPDWQWLIGATLPLNTESTAIRTFWQEASNPARELFFTRWRQHNPAAALTFLQLLWPEESASQRSLWLGLCRPQLSDNEAPWLESLLDDRSKQVRDTAIALLARLETSPWRQRMQAYAKACITVTTTPTLSILEITPPHTQTPEMIRDGLDQLTGQTQGLGEKAMWLRNLVAGAGGHWLLSHTGLSAEDLIASLQKTDWEEALLWGLSKAAIAEHCDPLLLALASSPRNVNVSTHAWLNAMTTPVREQAIQRMWQDPHKPAACLSDTQDIEYWAWSEAFSRSLLDALPQLKALGNRHSHTVSLLQHKLAMHGHAELLTTLPSHAIPPDVADIWQRRLHIRTVLDEA